MGMGDTERLEELIWNILDVLDMGSIYGRSYGPNIYGLSDSESEKEDQLEEIQNLINDYIEKN
jgi:predicted sugar kinase